MTETILPLALDGLLVVLLLATIVYAMILNRKLNRLRGNHEEMDTFVDKLNVACARAEAATAGLRSAGENGKSVFRDAASKAEALRDELAFLVERADIVAGRLANASEGTTVVQPQASSQAGVRSEAPRKQPAKRQQAAAVRRGADQGRAPAPGGGDAAPEPAASSPRSEAEEELLKALRNAR
ncbi:DUF6468 domain-containing protein [Nisaea acidiphila]|uniref:DUF6468 domain-containing protein n=1 Tax=Nisaea acidiphila TaxID=1862145 RepID=A0A9J7AUI2_9PROT|nr:DUF6468 domain-containing protein [Nisaea acidiphila]UUX50482.1 DUF6468 domain-containing protein [Nisaea acidiphila]